MVEILNLNDNVILNLPSPHKVHKNLRSYKKNVSRSLFSAGPSTSLTFLPEVSTQDFTLNDNVEVDTVPSIQTFDLSNSPQNTSTDKFNFIPPTWSKNKEHIMSAEPNFVEVEGSSDIIDREQDYTPFSVFKLLFSDEIIHLLVEQTNLYAQQKFL